MHSIIGRVVHWRRRSTLERADFLRYQPLLQRRSPLAPPGSARRPIGVHVEQDRPGVADQGYTTT